MISVTTPIRTVSGRGTVSASRSKTGVATSSRAIAVVRAPAPSSAGQRPPHRHADSALIAQLIACREQLPQTRERRRAEPDEVINLYRAQQAARQRAFATVDLTA